MQRICNGRGIYRTGRKRRKMNPSGNGFDQGRMDGGSDSLRPTS